MIARRRPRAHRSPRADLNQDPGKNLYFSETGPCTANLRTKILDFGGFDTSNILILRGEILRSIGNLPESLSQRILAGRLLAGRLGVLFGSGLVCLPHIYIYIYTHIYISTYLHIYIYIYIHIHINLSLALSLSLYLSISLSLSIYIYI